jgi:hypothetical protein
MASLPCKLQHGNTLVVNDNLKTSFQRTSEEPNYEMGYPLPDNGTYRLHLPHLHHLLPHRSVPIFKDCSSKYNVSPWHTHNTRNC